MVRKVCLLPLAFLLAAAPAGAQTVWRCGSSYSTQPCAGGAAIDVTDKSTPTAAARASKVAADDLKRAEAMEKARLAQERNAPKALVIGPKEAPATPQAKEHAKGGKDKKKQKEKEDDPKVFTASGPRPPKK